MADCSKPSGGFAFAVVANVPLYIANPFSVNAFALEHAASRPGAVGMSVATSAAGTKAAGQLVTRNLATVHAEPIRWLVRNFLPAGMLVLSYGPGGPGKSFLTLHVAAAMTRGRMPFGFDLPNPVKGKTLLVG